MRKPTKNKLKFRRKLLKRKLASLLSKNATKLSIRRRPESPRKTRCTARSVHKSVPYVKRIRSSL